MPIRAVLFDIGDTLWHGAEALPRAELERIGAERGQAFLDAAGLFHPDAPALARVAWAAIEGAIARAQATDLVEPDLGAVASQELRRSGLAVDAQAGRAFLEAIYVSGWEGGKRAYRDARPTLDELKARGFRLSTVTNRGFGGERFRRDLADCGLGVEWDGHVISCEVGYMKPHVTPFLRALADLGVAPAEALMVGNSLAQDIAGAQRLGIATAWKRSSPDAEGVAPDYEFEQLAELLELRVLRGAA